MKAGSGMKRVLKKNYKHLIDILILVIIIVGFKMTIMKDYTWAEMFDITVITGFVVSLVVSIISVVIRKVIMSYFEDSEKLTENYDKLFARYRENWLVYKKTNVKYPIIEECYCSDSLKLEVVDEKTEYELPEVIDGYRETLLMAHGSSSIYNTVTIRINDWEYADHTLYIKAGRSTYYKGLITNRAMDYEVGENISVRELLMPGPFIVPLKESKLSNHIGFNGFVVSKDGYVPFVLRHGDVSTGKHQYGTGLSASLKLKYVFEDKNEVMTSHSIHRAIVREIKDELKIEESQLKQFSNNEKVKILGVYRNVIEGGKPQFFVYAESCLLKDEIEELFKVKRENKGVLKKMKIEDGSKMLWIPLKDLDRLELGVDYFIYENKKYTVMVDAAACIAMYLNHKQYSENMNATVE